MNKVSISIFHLQILEPSTFISDIALGIACLLFYRYIKGISESKTHRYYALFFIFMSFSGFIGAFAHALYLYTGKPLQYVGWLMSGLSVYAMEMGVFSSFSNNKMRNITFRLSMGKLFLISIITMIYMNFLLVKINIVLGLLLVVSPILIFQYFTLGLKYNLYIVAGVVLALIPAVLHSLNINFGQYINTNDFNHYFLIICLFFVFIGLRGLIEAEIAESKSANQELF
jgi:hypothetical protein